jgi:predicted transposase/invertase (TIGR01784 family)
MQSILHCYPSIFGKAKGGELLVGEIMCLTTKYINPFTDYGFKKLFGEESSKPQLISFINAFLELDNKAKIVDLEFENLEKLGLSKRDRKTIFDIYCIDEDNNHILVELQRAEQSYFKDRMIYYSSILIQEQGLRGLYFDGKALNIKKEPRKVTWDYKLSAVYCIGILDFEFKDNDNSNYLHNVKLKDQNNEVFYDKLNYVFVEMPKFNKKEDELVTYLDKWFYFLNNLDSLDKIPKIFNDDKVIKNAFKKAEFINMSKEEQSVYLASLKEYRDWYAVLTTAEDKGIQKGLKEAKGKIEKALKEKEKALKKIERSILIFYKKGFTIEELSEDFDLSINDINKIINENK